MMTRPHLSSALDPDSGAASSAVQAEIGEYERLADSVRAMRKLLAEQEHTRAREACEDLLELAGSLEQRAWRRNADCDFKTGAGAADEHSKQQSPVETDTALGLLLAAQEHARQELLVTMEMLGDLQAHTRAIVAALQGPTPVLYDHRGRTRGPEGPTP